MTPEQDVKEVLDAAVEQVNRPEFVADDPVQFPREFGDLRDIEIVAFTSSLLAWGNRKMIIRDCRKMLDLMNWQPYDFVMGDGWRQLDPNLNIHRTFFVRHLGYFLSGLKEVYRRYPSLDAFCAAHGCGDREAPAWEFAEALGKVARDANYGEESPRCIPSNISTTALKRFNMALRWLVRDDGIVDMGVWKSIPKSKLYIPLDVHVGNISLQLGLLSRRSADRKAVDLLTAELRKFRPDDPCIYDFALFGLGVSGVGVF